MDNKKLIIKQHHLDALDSLLKSIEDDVGHALTIRMYDLNMRNKWKIRPFKSRKNLRVIGHEGSEAISGIYKSFDDIRSKLKQLQDDEKAANLQNKCRICGKNNYYNETYIDRINRKHHGPCAFPWNDVEVHDTHIGTPIRRGSVSISYSVADIEFIINNS